MTTSHDEADSAIPRIEHLSKSFPGVKALDDVSFSVHAGEIHALIGENGAGKSTMMKILAGIHQRDSGTIWLADESIVPMRPAEAQRLGISAVYQELSLAPNLTVAENIFVGREPTRFNLIRWRELHRRIRRQDRDGRTCRYPQHRYAADNRDRTCPLVRVEDSAA